jgi:hypothetical protein
MAVDVATRGRFTRVEYHPMGEVGIEIHRTATAEGYRDVALTTGEIFA